MIVISGKSLDTRMGAVALDLDERFAVWVMGIVQSVAIKPTEAWELLDGVIVY